MFHPTQMSADDTGILVIDVQEKLMPLIPTAPELIRNIRFLLDAAHLLRLPVQATEQYPKGLGATIPELAELLPIRPDKVAFSGCAIPSIVQGLKIEGRHKVVVVGIETHVCVQQTALDLLALEFRVYIPADAVGSRFVVDHDRALSRLERAGAIVTSSEAAVFEWVAQAGTPEFKEISRLVKLRAQAMPHGAR